MLVPEVYREFTTRRVLTITLVTATVAVPDDPSSAIAGSARRLIGTVVRDPAGATLKQDGDRVTFDYPGKSGQRQHREVTDRTIASSRRASARATGSSS